MLSEVTKTNNPVAGLEMASRWASVRRGMSTPLVDLKSSIALGSGADPSLLMAILWASMVINPIKNSRINKIERFIAI